MNKKQLSEYTEANYKLKDQKRIVKARTPVCGIGVNDAEYLTWTKEDGLILICPAYTAWMEIMRRCYKPREKEASYRKATICAEWHKFSAFRAWWLENWKEGWEIDKDLLTDSKSYGPTTCLFVPRWLNLLVKSKKSTAWKGGVRFYKGSYQARIAENGKRLHLGCFKTEGEAYSAWLERKLKRVEAAKDEIDAIDERIYPRVLEIINGI